MAQSENARRLDREYHNRIGAEYDQVILDPRQTASDRLFEALDFSPPTRFLMLDVGCGTGQAIFRFGLGNPKAERVVGIDHSESMLAVARRKLQTAGEDRIDLVTTDVVEWLHEAESEAFDLVTAIGFLHHLSDEGVGEALSRMASCTRPGGRIIVAEPMIDASISEPRLVRLWNRFSLARSVDYSVPAQEPEERPLPRALLYEAFENAGLKIRSHASSWEIFNWTPQPNWIERQLIRLLYRLGGPGIVNAWCLERAADAGGNSG